MSEFTLTGLRVVREVVRTGSFSLAARRLGYTQSAVSRQIASMESAAGERLFERQARGVIPTEAGSLLSRHANTVLAELETARQALDDLDAHPPGRLRVGSFSTAMAALVPDAIAAFATVRPQTEVLLLEALSSKLMERVASRRLDIGVINLTGDPTEGPLRLESLLEDIRSPDVQVLTPNSYVTNAGSSAAATRTLNCSGPGRASSGSPRSRMSLRAGRPSSD